MVKQDIVQVNLPDGQTLATFIEDTATFDQLIYLVHEENEGIFNDVHRASSALGVNLDPEKWAIAVRRDDQAIQGTDIQLSDETC